MRAVHAPLTAIIGNAVGKTGKLGNSRDRIRTAIEPLIVYVDDEHANRVVFQQTFGRRFALHVFERGADALEFAQTTPNVAIVLADQRMPGMSGNDLFEALKATRPEIVRIVITAYSDLEPILRAVNDGLVARYVVKPWDKTELTQILEWGLGTYALGGRDSAAQIRLLETERLATLGTLAAAVFHDLRQPLSYMTANTERLQYLIGNTQRLHDVVERGIEPTDEERKHLVELAVELPEIVSDLNEGCRLMVSLTRSVQELVQPPSSDPVRVADPALAVGYALQVCRHPSVRTGVKLVHDPPTSTLLHSQIEPAKLTQVLINLVMNAVQSYDNVERTDKMVRVALFAGPKNRVEFVIEDDGAGMSREVLERVGTPFFSTREAGTGLGLMQCRRLIEGAGGSFELKSEPGKGTSAQFWLPGVAPDASNGD